VLEFDADYEMLQRILGNYDGFTSLSMQDAYRLLGVETQPQTLKPAKYFDRSPHEYPAKVLLPKNLSHDKPDVAMVVNSSVTQHNDRTQDIPTCGWSFGGAKSAKSMPVNNGGITASVLVKATSDVKNDSYKNKEISQITSKTYHTAVKPESINVFTPQIKKRIAKIMFREPVPQHIKEMFAFPKSLLKKPVSRKLSVYSFGKKFSKCVFPKKECNENCATVNGVRFKDKQKPQLWKVCIFTVYNSTR